MTTDTTTTGPAVLRRELEHFTDMAAASADVAGAEREHRLWLALAAEVRAYLTPAAAPVAFGLWEQDDG